MGYRPDPVLSALNIYRHSHQTPHYQSTLAWINAHPDRNAIQGVAEYHAYWVGAQRRAEEMGYRVEEFWYKEPGMTSQRFCQVLRTRQITGILLAPKFDSPCLLQLPWEFFSCVAFGLSHGIDFHLVTGTQFSSARLAVRKMHAHGYRKIAIFVSDAFEKATDRNFSSGMYAECAELGCRFLTLKLATKPTSAQIKNAVAWLKKNRPEAILAYNLEIFELLGKAKLRMPEDVAVAMIARDPSRAQLASIDKNPEHIGSVAVDQLIGMINRNEKGLPIRPLKILVGSDWIDGSSMPPLPVRSPYRRK